MPPGAGFFMMPPYLIRRFAPLRDEPFYGLEEQTTADPTPTTI